MLAPGVNVDVAVTPNQAPNSRESVNARQTRLRGAPTKIFRSTRSARALGMIRNLQVAYYPSGGLQATIRLPIAKRLERPVPGGVGDAQLPALSIHRVTPATEVTDYSGNA